MYHRAYGQHLIMLCIAVLGCGEDQNLLQYSVSKASKESTEYLLADADIYLNKAQYEKAVENAEKVLKLDSENEHGAIVAGYGYLGLAGIDAFKLAATFSKKESKEKEAATTLTGNQLIEESAGSSNPLAGLQEILGLSEDEIKKITVTDNKITADDGSVIEGAPQSGLFKDYPILFPKSSSVAREAALTLYRINKAIKAICPFVNPGARVVGETSDSRHEPDACPPANRKSTQNGKIHYIWAFSHLTEAIAFNSVIMYDPSGKGANLLRRSDALGDANSVGIANYILGVKELASTMEYIFPVDPKKSKESMLTAMVNDLEATSRGFDQMPGMPESMTKSIKESLKKLDEQKTKIQSSGQTDAGGAASSISDAEAKNSALKDTLTKELGEKLQTQITEKIASGAISTEEKASVCSAYTQIVGTSQVLEACN